MNVYDWLSNLPFHDPAGECRVVEISFNQGSRKDFFRNATPQIFEKGDLVSVEGVGGFDVGTINVTGELVRIQMKKKGVDEFHPDMKKILRRSSDRDLELCEQHKGREKEAVIRSRAIARQLRLNMKVSQVEFQADGRKATFFYIADDRVDFRELIKVFASEFRVKVEMRQIGARQEAGKVGGIGSCGRELCCSTWLTDFKSVNTTAARYQNLSINQSKLSGQCGRLKCCLNYELDTYLDALQQFPDNAETLQVAKGNALLIKKDIFKNLMWYVLPDSNKQYPLQIERVKEIRRMNMRSEIPDDLGAVEVATGKPKEEEMENVDLTGQFSLQTLEKADRKKRQQRQQGRGNDRPPQGRGNDRPPQGRGNDRPPQGRGDDRPPQGPGDDRPPQGRGNERPSQGSGRPPRIGQDRNASRGSGPERQGRGNSGASSGPRTDRPNPGGENPQGSRADRPNPPAGGARQDRGNNPRGNNSRGPRPDRPPQNNVGQPPAGRQKPNPSGPGPGDGNPPRESNPPAPGEQ